MSVVHTVDLLGFSAAFLTLVTFAQRRMTPMRIAAIGANVVFVAYGALGGIYPVLVLHLVLFPINVARLRSGLAHGRTRPTPAPRPDGSHMMCWVRTAKHAPTSSYDG